MNLTQSRFIYLTQAKNNEVRLYKNISLVIHNNDCSLYSEEFDSDETLLCKEVTVDFSNDPYEVSYLLYEPPSFLLILELLYLDILISYISIEISVGIRNCVMNNLISYCDCYILRDSFSFFYFPW